jgi:hypothetical protein
MSISEQHGITSHDGKGYASSKRETNIINLFKLEKLLYDKFELLTLTCQTNIAITHPIGYKKAHAS